MKPSELPNSNGVPRKDSASPNNADDVSLANVDNAAEGAAVEKRDDTADKMQTRAGEKLSAQPIDKSEFQKPPKKPKPYAPNYARFNWGVFLKNRRLEMTSLIIALLVSNFFVLHVWNFESRFERARQAPKFLPLWQQLETVELSLYDARFTNRGPRIPNCLDDIAIIGLDQASLAALKMWPTPRSWHGKLIRRLKKAGAKVIVFDMDFGDRQNLLEDTDLAKAMAEAGNVILPSYDDAQTDILEDNDKRELQFLNSPLLATDYDDWWFFASKEIKNDPKMRAAYNSFKELGIDEQTPDLAVATLYQDLDKSFRRCSFRAEYHDGTVRVGGLAILAAALFEKNLVDGRKNEAYELALKSGVFPTLNNRMQNVPLQYNPPAHANAPIFYTTPIYFWGPSQTFATYSYKDALGFKIALGGKPITIGYSDAEMKKRFKDKLVFIGSTAHILKDRFHIPRFNTRLENTGRIDNTDELDGVEIHASVAAMLLDGEYIRTVKPRTTMILVYLFSLGVSLWTVILRGWVNSLSGVAQARASKIGLRLSLHAVIWFTLYGLLLVPPLFGFWQACQWLFEAQNLWVIVVYPLGSAVTSSVLALLMLYGAESVERRKTIAQLGAYVAPEVRDEILAQAEGDYVRPRRVEATMLFTDLEGFTSYSEEHEPEEVVEALNDYFDRMVHIIRAHGGGPDKFIGDAVMAFFGVPVPRYDHASQAVLCAIAMQEECARFREDTGIEFYMRIGIHSGELIAGSIGATKAGFLNYTTIGDTVNLASRLEGKNKEFGSWIMCSATTFEAARDLVEGDSASTHIKGKAQDVEVYIVHGLKGHREQSLHWGHELSAAPGAALTHKQKEEAAFGDRRDNRALSAPTEEVSEGKSL